MATPPKNLPSDLTIEDEVAEAIKTKFTAPDLTIGKNHFMDPKTHTGLDYTAGGRLHCRWVNNQPQNVLRHKQKGFVLPEEVSARLKNVEHGSLILMVRPKEYEAQHQTNVELENRKWESKVTADAHAAKNKSNGLGEFEVTPSAKLRR
jgi:hypothetical protein